MKTLLIVLGLIFSSFASAGDLKSFHLIIKDGVFDPSTLKVPVGEKFNVEIQNKGSSAEEFESVELNREKVIAPGKSVTLFLGPLSKGEYKFFGDFHKDTARGKLIAQ